MSRKLWLLGGMTPGGRIFAKLAPLLDNCEVIDWIPPRDARNISEYAERLAVDARIDSSCDLLGVSFGGIVAQELAPLIGAELCGVVSSVASTAEFQTGQRIFGRLPTAVHEAALRTVGGISAKWPQKNSSHGQGSQIHG